MSLNEKIFENLFSDPTISTNSGKPLKLGKSVTSTTFDGSENDKYAQYPFIEKPEYVGKLETGDEDPSKHIKKTFPGVDLPSAARVMFDANEQYIGYKDSREMPNSTYNNPTGIIYTSMNIKTGNIDVYPAEIKETIKTTKKSPIGPNRSLENSNRRRNVGEMYGIPRDIMSSFLGYDSNGKPKYSEGQSYIEKCIFTGYDRSFIEPSAVLNVFEKEWENPESTTDYTATINMKQQIFADDTIWISKSGLYYTRSLPVKNIFLGYNDNDVIPTKNPLTWMESKDINIGGNSTKPLKARDYYTDQIGLFELQNHKKINIEGSEAEKSIQYDRNLVKEFPINEPIYWSDKEIKRLKSLNIFDQNIIDNLTAKSYVKNSKNGSLGSYRKLLYSLSKVDILEYVSEIGSDTFNPIQGKGVSSEINLIYPKLKRRSEQYGPNPMQHLFFMDFYDWRKYETNYTLKQPSGPYFDLSRVFDLKPSSYKRLKELGLKWTKDINRLSFADRARFVSEQQAGLTPSIEKMYYDTNFGEFQLPNDKLMGLTNVYIYSNGRISNGLSRHPYLSESAVLLSDRFRLSSPEVPNVYVDNTYILDVYFGLMELHLKSFSWKTIMTIIDMIPQFYGDYLDNSKVNWKSQSKYEKSRIRMKQLDESLKPVWDVITKLLYEYEIRNSGE